ncbi:hypothetical protein SteCoe_7442 [Stentor coeruleus]|uniref:Myb-like DNA-binding domain containing protein n=1 Tax=Stentor coeruleus TaxID=5963 RepID=A0A1R2CMR3_9CILI|nr:hypothetical protein SteCoe_7442 [Stentor coeruleus]
MSDPIKYRKIWKAEEDLVLVEITKKYQMKQWKIISKELSEAIGVERTEKQCRERWKNNLETSSGQAQWSEKDRELLFFAQLEHGNKWSKISRIFPGKSKNSVKNFYYSTIRRNLRRFNKGKLPSEQINGPIDILMKVPEVRKILTSSKNCSKDILSSQKLSKISLDLLKGLDPEIDNEPRLSDSLDSEINNADISNYLSLDDMISIYPYF